MPYVIKAAFTGSAAIVINGQTLHNAFSFKFGNEFISLNDKERDRKRDILRKLRVVIIDEMSMLTPDILIQLHLRLCEIKQCHNKLFGGIGVFLFGDLMQLPPIKGNYIFEKPINSNFLPFFEDWNIWQSFEVLNLVTNHRQGNFKRYADLLNRMRLGGTQMTNEDIALLEARVRPSINDKDIPKDALNIFCTNKEVNDMNELKLEMNPNEEYILKADHICDTQLNFKPSLEYGKVKNTPCVNELRLKIGAEVMLTYNLDVCDSLANGSKGTVIDIIKTSTGKVRYIIVQFHDPEAGKERRKRFSSMQKDYPDKNPTPIEKLDFSYSLSKKAYSNSTMAKVIQFPLALAYSITGHKSQGQTIKRPRALVTDLRKAWHSAKSLAYVICSRIESLDQLFILGDLPLKKFEYISEAAKDEMERLEKVSINKNPNPWFKNNDFSLKISSLNIRSLNKHFEDIKADHALMKSDIICLTETWIPEDSSNIYRIDGYNNFMNNVGFGKGIAIYAKPSFSHVCNVNGEGYQITKMTSDNIDIICVYRSDLGSIEELYCKIYSKLTPLKLTMICGDFNICALENSKNLLTQSLLAENFKQIVKYPTHEKGGLIDHIYIKNTPEIYDVYHHSVYYSDHDGICVTFGSLQQTNEQAFPNKNTADTDYGKYFKPKKNSRKRKSSFSTDKKDFKKLKLPNKVNLENPLRQNLDTFDCMVCLQSEAKCCCYVDTENY